LVGERNIPFVEQEYRLSIVTFFRNRTIFQGGRNPELV
jgi:hypothetical protein